MKNCEVSSFAWQRAREDIIEWDVPNWAVALGYWSRQTRHDLASVEALEIGSRHGGLSLWLALHGAHVVCTDVDGPSLAAREKHAAYNVSILYQAANSFSATPWRFLLSLEVGMA